MVRAGMLLWEDEWCNMDYFGRIVGESWEN